MIPATVTIPNASVPVGKTSVKKVPTKERELATDVVLKAAGIMIVTPDSLVLFLKRATGHDHEGEWCLPGGAIEQGETAELAAIRECREETGHIPDGKLKEVDNSVSPEGVDFTTFALQVNNPFIAELDDEHVGWAWAPLDDPPEPLHPGVANTIHYLKTHLRAAFAQDSKTEPEHKLTLEFDGDFNMGGFIRHLHHLGAIGASREVNATDSDDKPVRFGWDGDGADKIWSALLDGLDVLKENVAKDAKIANVATPAELRSVIKFPPPKAANASREIDQSFARGGAGKELQQSTKARRFEARGGLTEHDKGPGPLGKDEVAVAIDAFRFDPDQVEKAWATLKVEVIYAPHTGSTKPWELYGVFSYPYKSRVHWGSFKTKEAAEKKAAVSRQRHGIAEDKEFKEADHPRGQPGNAGQFGSGGGGKSKKAETQEKGEKSSTEYKPGVHAQGLDPADAKKKEWAASSPIKTVDDLLKDAPKYQEQLSSVLGSIAEKLGLDFHDPGVKSRERIERKVNIDKRPTNRVTDVVRGGVSINKPSEGDDIVKELAKHFEVTDEGWFVTPAGYFDRKAMVRFDNGQVGEVQIWHPDLLRAKEHEGGHKYYVESQSYPIDDPRRKELEKRQLELYSKVTGQLSPEWKALLGMGGSAKDENFSLNSAFDSVLASIPTEALSTRTHSSSRKTHASPGVHKAGSPSHEQNLISASVSDILRSFEKGHIKDTRKDFNCGDSRRVAISSVVIGGRKS